MKEASDLLPNRLMEPFVIWLHDDMAKPMVDVCGGGIMHVAERTVRPDR